MPTKSDKSYAVSVCLSGIFGLLGVHHFYLGRWFYGLLDLSHTLLALYFICISENIFLGITLLIIDIVHTFIVTIMLLIGNYKDGDGKLVAYPNQKI